MPMPTPGADEAEDAFMDRCMSNDHMREKFPDGEQRAAVCHGQFDEGHDMGRKKAEAASGLKDSGVRLALSMEFADAATVEILVVPDGTVASVNGDFVVDAESFDLMQKAFFDHGTDLPIDYEHQSLGGKWSSPTGKAPAAGWIKALRYQPGTGIFASVAWTDEAKKEIRTGAYKYLSPVVVMRKSDRKVVELHSAALTNKPAIEHMAKVAAKADAAGETEMQNLKDLRAALAAAGVALDDAADDDAVLTAAKAYVEASVKKAAEPPALSAVASKLGLEKTATTEMVVAKVAELQTNVPKSEYTAVVARLESLEATAKTREAQELVACAIENAKLNPNDPKQMDWARKYAAADLAGFKSWSEAAPAPYGAGRVVKPNAALDGGDDRKSVILAAKEEFKSAGNRVAGLRQDSWINQTLRDKGMEILSADEKKAL